MTKKRKTIIPAPDSYRVRSYRNRVETAGLVSTRVTVRETDMHILAARDLTEEAAHYVVQYRTLLETYIAAHPGFVSALVPLATDPFAPPMVKEMFKAATATGVGPMAAVAGVIAEFVGRDLLARHVDEVIIENGGDIFLKRDKDVTVSIFAGASTLSDKIGVRLEKSRMPLGVCTSSGTVGHSLSLGKADAVTVLAGSTALADAAATRLGNEVKNEKDIAKALAVAKTLPGLEGVVIVVNDKIGAWGEVELTKI